MKTVLEVRDIKKEYKLFDTQKDLLKEVFLGKKKHKVKHALKGVSFDVYEGETFGILGGNGSGKSTILSIINGTTIPTSGTFVAKGAVSLLTVGAGLIQGFTGYENIEYKCGILGLTKDQVALIRDDIIEFSEIGDDYLKQPIKNYSSGMRSKLGFAIAIHITPKILIIDEALAVGDKLFQNKCHDKINELKNNGVTILYVSHNHGQVKSICDRACWIQQGELICIGKSDKVSSVYDQFMSKKKTLKEIKDALAKGEYELS